MIIVMGISFIALVAWVIALTCESEKLRWGCVAFCCFVMTLTFMGSLFGATA